MLVQASWQIMFWAVLEWENRQSPQTCQVMLQTQSIYLERAHEKKVVFFPECHVTCRDAACRTRNIPFYAAAFKSPCRRTLFARSPARSLSHQVNSGAKHLLCVRAAVPVQLGGASFSAKVGRNAEGRGPSLQPRRQSGRLKK